MQALLVGLASCADRNGNFVYILVYHECPCEGFVSYATPHTLHIQENYTSLHMIYCEINIYSDNPKFQMLLNEIFKYVFNETLVISHKFAV
jgi:hypothetical protein